jgi:hypothetical protein
MADINQAMKIQHGGSKPEVEIYWQPQKKAE